MTPTKEKAAAECRRLAETHSPKRPKWTRPLSPRARDYLKAINAGERIDTLTAHPGEAGAQTKIIAVLRRRKYITAKNQITYAGKMQLLYWETRTND